jgi:DNA-binding NarL/FixJ family response regulator
MPPKSIRLLLLDDKTLVLADLMDLIGVDPEFIHRQKKLSCKKSEIVSTQCSYLLPESLNQNIEFYLASGIKEAGRIVSTLNPAVIIFDVHTRYSNSYDLIKRWQEFASIVVTSDFYSVEIERQVLSLGASSYLPRPSHFDDLEQVFANILSKAGDAQVLH